MFGQYRLGEAFRNAAALFYTMIFFPGARLIRGHFRLRGGKRHMEYGKGLTLGYDCRFDLAGVGKTLIFGSNVKMNDRVHIVAHEKVELGDNVLIASNVFISDTSHGSTDPYSLRIAPDLRELITNPVLIGSNTWIGEGAVILPGACIGEGCVIGAGAVVTKNIPANSVAVGVPAQVIKRSCNDSKLP